MQYFNNILLQNNRLHNMAAIFNSLMDRGCWESKEFNARCVHAQEKNSKLFTLHEFSTHGREKNMSILSVLVIKSIISVLQLKVLQWKILLAYSYWNDDFIKTFHTVESLIFHLKNWELHFCRWLFMYSSVLTQFHDANLILIRRKSLQFHEMLE